MKIPIILTSTKGKSPKELAGEVMKAIKNFSDKKKEAETQEPKVPKSIEKLHGDLKKSGRIVDMTGKPGAPTAFQIIGAGPSPSKMKQEKPPKTTISEEKIRELLIYYKEEIKALGLNMVWPAVFKKHYHGKCKSINTRIIGGFSILDPCGDEEVCSLMFCENCQSCHLNCYHDQFIGDGDFTYEQEITKEEAEAVKEAILKCENPHNKHCRCKYHEKLGEILYRELMGYAKQEMPKRGLKWSDEEKTWVEI